MVRETNALIYNYKGVNIEKWDIADDHVGNDNPPWGPVVLWDKIDFKVGR